MQSKLGEFYECLKCNIIISYNIDTHALPDMYALGPQAYMHTYQAEHSCPMSIIMYAITIT